jgi:hypothetical protein
VDAGYNVYVTDLDKHTVQKFGLGPTAAQPMSWGRIKALYWHAQEPAAP